MNYKKMAMKILNLTGDGIVSKNTVELIFWRLELKKYVDWFNGSIELYGIPPPSQKEKVVISKDAKKNACITWNTMYQQKKYLTDLKLDINSFSGERVLDVGAGPHPNALCFLNCDIYGIDPLMDKYKNLGYPREEYDKRYHFINCKAEMLPFQNAFFDAAISVNAIDHVNNIEQISEEIRRVLKPNGKFRIHVHYHKPTKTEPLKLNDKVFTRVFGWVCDLKKVSECTTKDIGFTKVSEDESFVIWSNF